MPVNAKKKKSVGEILGNLSMPILLLLLIVFFSIMTDKFFTPLNLTNILVQNVHVAVCACAVMIIMVSGGCDLSIGYQMSVAAVLVTKLISVGDWNYGHHPQKLHHDYHPGHHGHLPGHFLPHQRIQNLP